jgi:hypothetical protein
MSWPSFISRTTFNTVPSEALSLAAYRDDMTALVCAAAVNADSSWCPRVASTVLWAVTHPVMTGVTNREDAAAADEREGVAKDAATATDRVELEVDFAWVGEPNISFFVELALTGYVAEGWQYCRSAVLTNYQDK